MMNPQIKTQWIAALQSGEYAQCKGTLTQVTADGKESHCCLGVLTELAVKAGVITRNNTIRDDGSVKVSYGEAYESGTASYEVRKWAGLDDPNPNVEYGEFGDDNKISLAELNDGARRLSRPVEFPEIAAIINAQL